MNKLTSTDFNQIGIAGDWHGNTGWAKHALMKFSHVGVKHILHVGDFGFWPGNSGRKYRYKVNKFLALYGMTLYVTLGNHEDYVKVASFVEHPTMEGFVYHVDYPHILVAKRGARWEWNDVSFVSLGGANSIDFTGRTEGISWWKEERISLGDIYRTVEGGHADIMISHDCPAGVNIFGSHRDASNGWSPTEIAYAQESRVALRQAVDGVKPDILFHGHYHRFLDLTTELFDGVEGYTLRSIGLDMDDSQKNLMLFELATRDYLMI
jgi:predicted phosphodiesterase